MAPIPPPSRSGDRINLTLPAEPEYGRIARIAGSSIALRLGLPFADIEDIRLAIDETIILLLRPEGGPGDITVEFIVEPTQLVIEASTTAGTDQHWLNEGARTRFDELVGETVDEHEIDEDLSRVRLVKRF